MKTKINKIKIIVVLFKNNKKKIKIKNNNNKKKIKNLKKINKNL